MTTHRLSERSTGVCVISAAPFSESGGIDLGSLDTLVEYYIHHSVHGITMP